MKGKSVESEVQPCGICRLSTCGSFDIGLFTQRHHRIVVCHTRRYTTFSTTTNISKCSTLAD